MHSRKFFLRFVGPGDEVEIHIEHNTQLLRTRASYIARMPAKRAGKHRVRFLVGEKFYEGIVPSQRLREVEGWKVRVPGEPEGGPSDAPPFTPPLVPFPPPRSIAWLAAILRRQDGPMLTMRWCPESKEFEVLFDGERDAEYHEDLSKAIALAIAPR